MTIKQHFIGQIDYRSALRSDQNGPAWLVVDEFTGPSGKRYGTVNVVRGDVRLSGIINRTWAYSTARRKARDYLRSGCPFGRAVSL